MSIKNILPSERKREFIVKSDDYELTKYGLKPEERQVNELIRLGVINVDKHPNPTSQEIVAYIKRIFNLRKAGHSGTLDPAVTGILPVALEDATKITDALLPAGKEYACIMHLHEKVDDDQIHGVFKEFTGEIFQKPPVKSSVKRILRKRTIYYMDLLEIKDQDVLFIVGCEKGTYIRKLCHDMGLVLGTGAHMKELRRTKSGPFREDETLSSLIRIFDAYEIYKESKDEEELRKVVLPMEEGLTHLPKIVIRDNSIGAICHGASLAVPGVLKIHDIIEKDTLVLLESLKGEAVALANATMSYREILSTNNGIAAKTSRVLMDRDVYPKIWKESAKK
ncbi:MAG: RNA-guided pseudouridylation complex pseudouridine synthase subunit Cbf5 [Candidatus Heimdallarchaeota archaeon]|nr:RNA-guided pseudouridylation complex pseudouridine synthase subunit Cbf5 [Candidatus Heimdallarchaeota archaeon]MBY8995778.1 RNA-guided pseudouridylation complex pseudouridine synthase subunit Cbf5 [Candidatus Heimdallarchaeota archaeon]